MVQDDGAELLGAVGAGRIISGHLIRKSAACRDLDLLEAGAQAVQFLTEQFRQIDGLGEIAGIVFDGCELGVLLGSHSLYSPFSYFLDLATRMLGCS